MTFARDTIEEHFERYFSVTRCHGIHLRVLVIVTWMINVVGRSISCTTGRRNFPRFDISQQGRISIQSKSYCFEKYVMSSYIFKLTNLCVSLSLSFSLCIFVYIQDSIFKKSKGILEYRVLINAKDSYETMKNATKLETVVHIDGRTIVYTKRKSNIIK